MSDTGNSRSFAAGLVLGALIGAGVALLFAPQSGQDTRRLIKRRARRFARDARERYDDLRDKARDGYDDVRDRVDEARDRVRDRVDDARDKVRSARDRVRKAIVD